MGRTWKPSMCSNVAYSTCFRKVFFLNVRPLTKGLFSVAGGRKSGRERAEKGSVLKLRSHRVLRGPSNSSEHWDFLMAVRQRSLCWIHVAECSWIFGYDSFLYRTPFCPRIHYITHFRIWLPIRRPTCIVVYLFSPSMTTTYFPANLKRK